MASFQKRSFFSQITVNENQFKCFFNTDAPCICAEFALGIFFKAFKIIPLYLNVTTGTLAEFNFLSYFSPSSLKNQILLLELM
ncbi:hypothetical protein [Pigmentibacter ruber]|uniref:hypothetical protein n=1 Tax=Pigmentibacter ruber TaxID=2683196 RepID=UPI00131AF44A|nr:hypothetical protein [Pigmentibacter ruber]